MEVSVSLKKAIENYINGDQSAFTVIYNESHRYIYVCVNNVMSGNDNKEDMICDIMQDTYLEICKHINSLQNVNHFLSWAGTIATRKCYEYIKKSGKYALLNEDESFDSLADDDNIIPEEIMQNKEKQRLLREIIQNELTEMQKLCVVGYFYNEMKQSEIAKELGIPENSVKSHLLRAKAKIKEYVLDLEKNKGTKLYSVAPLLLLLFVDEIKDCVVSPAIGQAVSASVGVGVEVVSAGAGATGTAASTFGANVATAAASVVKVKAIVIAAVAAVTVGGIGAGVGIAVHNAKEEEPVNAVGTTDETTELPTEKVTEELTEAPTEELTEEDWDKTVYEEAAIEVLKNSWDDSIAFMDLDNDGIPELLVSTYYDNVSDIYKFDGNEYVLSRSTTSFCPWDSKIYKDSEDKILVLGVNYNGMKCYSVDGENFYFWYRFFIVNMTINGEKFLGSILSEEDANSYHDCIPYVCHIYQEEEREDDSPMGNGGGYAGVGNVEVSKDELEQFLADAVKDYTFIMNTDEIYVEGVSEKSIKEAYEVYLDMNSQMN